MLMDALERLTGIETKLCTLGEGGAAPLRGREPLVLKYSGKYNNPRVLLSTALSLRKVIDSHDFDILHTHGLDADLVGSLAARGREIKLICHLHITPPRQTEESYKARLRRWLFWYMTHSKQAWYIAVSEAVRMEMANYYRLPLDRITTVRNGVNADEYSKNEELSAAAEFNAAQRVIIGTAGRLEAMKGFEYLIQAAEKLRERGLVFELLVAGDGARRVSLEQFGASHGFDGEIRFLGHVGDMPGFYAGIDLFVLPSVSTEGLPLVLLEAMSAGRPVVVSRLAGTPEVVRHGIEGLLVPPGDVDGLVNAVFQLACDPQQRQRMGVMGRQRVEQAFCMERVANEIRQVYARVLSE